ncbi:uncharacterized protein A4U43_C08F15420 [Asparagus officinalis]|uniref:GTP-binding protein At3g49725, chloroplastic n=1 Tax=Asparagus officinalis TaxID=4686 RepID=UPI00098E3C71|nr:GTP-binding protein At3g49725, chloroplastic [Asparagus officinalis]XP_020241573.1 GTP-binding protein At3g49725, chloroplastic [Asparagus officinalis]ONK60197.1 uncharacterized protein A4U43_C08F15420 [Asparagus officinalis]
MKKASRILPSKTPKPRSLLSEKEDAEEKMLRSIHKTLKTPPPPISLRPISFPFSSRSRRRQNITTDGGHADKADSSSSSSLFNSDPEGPPRLFVVQPRLRPELYLHSKLSEALNLANSLEEQRDGFYAEDSASKEVPPHLVVQDPSSRSLRADTYFGPGTMENIKVHLRALESKEGLDAVFVNTILSGIQQRNLEMAWKKPVLDRVGLIIEIFNAHAETKEAKLQAELAALMYKRSRLVRVRGPGGRLTFGTSGEAEVVSARGRGSGGRGFISGAGETELQLQRRRIHERRNYLLSQIEDVRRTRAIQRSARKRHGDSHGKGLATVGIVGYTNAGKSTLASTLSKSDVYSDDRLFATVDPRLRRVILPSGRKVLLSDTVGFISDLPIQLVEAFRATLEEVVEADLLVHVLDASAPDMEEQRATVLEVLQQIGVSKEKIQNMIEVWNKIDLLDKKMGACETFEGDEWQSEGEEGHETILADECLSEGKEGYETISEKECLSGVEEETISEAEDGFISDHEGDNTSLESFEKQEAISLEKWGTTDFKASADAKHEHVKTSAVMGIGLQELLEAIDKRLDEKKFIVTRSFGPFDRKWRPSYTEDTDKIAQQ